MQIYKHRQIGPLIWLGLGVAIVLGASILILADEAHVVTGVTLAILLLALFLFHGLTVEVTTEAVTASFGPGWIRRTFSMEDIQGARIVRNRWYYGWGIRFTPHGWMFNVSGLSAVELELAGNRRFRIGTDEPERLLNSIHTAREHAGRAG
jgi:hypothetical protein